LRLKKYNIILYINTFLIKKSRIILFDAYIFFLITIFNYTGIKQNNATFKN
jgi:hypothetical protein